MLKVHHACLYKLLQTVFVNLEVQTSWQAQHFVNLDVQISWQAQHSKCRFHGSHSTLNLEVEISWQAQHFVLSDAHSLIHSLTVTLTQMAGQQRMAGQQWMAAGSRTSQMDGEVEITQFTGFLGFHF